MQVVDKDFETLYRKLRNLGPIGIDDRLTQL